MCDFSFSDLGWRSFSREKLDRLGVSPNELRAHEISNAGSLIVRKSTKYAEYALSKNGLDYLNNALHDHKIADAIVVTARWDGAKQIVVCKKPVGEVVASLEGVPPRDGPLGPYWWMNADLTPFTRSSPEDDYTPF
jgi:hypothetical protein